MSGAAATAGRDKRGSTRERYQGQNWLHTTYDIREGHAVVPG
jgi:hypothetical protein